MSTLFALSQSGELRGDPIAKGYLVAAPGDIDDAEEIMEQGEVLYDTGWHFPDAEAARAHVIEYAEDVVGEAEWEGVNL